MPHVAADPIHQVAQRKNIALFPLLDIFSSNLAKTIYRRVLTDVATGMHSRFISNFHALAVFEWLVIFADDRSKN